MDMDELKALKAQRTSLKAKVKTSSTRLLKGITKKADDSLITHYSNELFTAYADFEEVDETYSAAVEEDDQLAEEFGVVNGLDCAAYSSEVENIFNGAWKTYHEYKLRMTASSFRENAEEITRLFTKISKENRPQQITKDLKRVKTISEELPQMIESRKFFTEADWSQLSQEMKDFQIHVEQQIDEIELKLEGSSVPIVPTDPVVSTVPTVSIAQIDPTAPVVSTAPIGSTATIVSTAVPTVSTAPIVTSVPIVPTDPVVSTVPIVPTAPGVSTVPIVSTAPIESTAVPIVTTAISVTTPVTMAPMFPRNLVSISQPLWSTSTASVPSSFSLYPPSIPISPLTVSSTLQPTALPFNPHPIQSEVKVKRAELPLFSGKRSDWPEFKTLWPKMAIPSFSSKETLASELRRCCDKGQAAKIVRTVSIVGPQAFDEMWQRLVYFYEDPAASVNEIMRTLQSLKPVKAEDYRYLTDFVNTIETCYTQLANINHLDCISLLDVDNLSKLLPVIIKEGWHERHHSLPSQDQLHPFQEFTRYLIERRRAVSRLVETQNTIRKKEVSAHSSRNKNEKQMKFDKPVKHIKPKCATHDADVNHNTENCRTFLKLSREEKLEALKKVNACFRCFKYHARGNCPNFRAPCDLCGKTGHHTLLCFQHDSDPMIGTATNSHNSNIMMSPVTKFVSSHSLQQKNKGLYAIFTVPLLKTKKLCTIFTDDGSDSSYITNKAAKRLGARKLNKYILEVTTTGGQETEYESQEYEIDLVTKSGKVVTVQLFGIDKITSPVSQLNLSVIKQLFPEYDASLLQRHNTEVDIMIGSDFFGLHPKREVCSAGENLSIMEGSLGVCIQGSHPSLSEEISMDSNMIRIIKSRSTVNNLSVSFKQLTYVHHSFLTLPIQHTKMHSTKIASSDINDFIRGAELATQVNPICGSCKCGKCPLPGHTFSLQEEMELKIIREGLTYDVENQHWICKYPWKFDPSTLPNNYSSVLSTLRSLEKNLMKDEEKSHVYHDQVMDMITRNAARKLSSAELSTYTGPVFYISHLGVPNPRSKSTPFRIVFNSSQLFKGASLNNWLYKGPDAYLNNQIGVLLRWRENPVGISGDIRKMFNAIHLHKEEQHCHRFLWTNLKYGETPDIYVMTRVNMGDRPAGTISTEALYMTAEMFETEHIHAARFLKQGSYVDDLLESVEDHSTAKNLTEDTEKLLHKGGFQIKYWLISGEENEDEVTEVLGVCWVSEFDNLVFRPSLNFSPKKHGLHTGPDLKSSQVPAGIPEILTKRMVLSQVMRVYDPMGLLCPFTLQGKVLLRETWEINLKWDDPLPNSLKSKWIKFLCSIYDLHNLVFPRSIKPPGAIGEPTLVLMSDASDKAYGVVAYARWNCEDGTYKSKFILAKNRIAPLTKRSTPQLELNAALLSKRLREVIENEMRYKFEKVLHLIDSETVLAMLQKVSTRFKLYEGVRIGEIQAATKGDVSSWAWVPGVLNVSDWLTRGKDPPEIDADSEWFKGPSFLSKPVESWNLKFTPSSTTSLPGEKKVVDINHAERSHPIINYARFGRYTILVNVVSRVVNSIKKKSLASISECLTPIMLAEGEKAIMIDVQKSIRQECEKIDSKGRMGGNYHRLKPVLQEGLYVVGTRLVLNPLVPENKPQILLPTKHLVTSLIMIQSHKLVNHGGRDATLAKFRQRFWAPHGSKLASTAVQSCRLCKIRIPKLMSQKMGMLPPERCMPAPAFTYTMIDYFGPYNVRGEIQKRISGKSWGVIFTDMVSRAVWIEAVYDYSTSSFLLALSKFAFARGYPHTIYSDNDPKLTCASSQLDEQWKRMWEQEGPTIINQSSQNGVQWRFSTPDAPWMNGAVESLIRSIKKAICFAMNNQRLSPFEFSALLYEVANTLNERPIGTLTSSDSSLSIITPNSLLIGRSQAKNPLGWQPDNDTTLLNRYHLVQQISDCFWNQWIKTCAPSLMTDTKWHSNQRDLRPGDVVLVLDSDAIRSEYRLAVVKTVYPSRDGVVRKVLLSYRRYKVGESCVKYTGSIEQNCIRPVQRLALVVPVDDQ